MGWGCASGSRVLSSRVGLKEGEGVPFRALCANKEAGPLRYPFARPVREGG